MDRKEFIKKAGAVSALSLIGVSLVSCSNDDEIGLDGPITIDLDQAPFDALQSNDGWLLHPTENVLLINVNQDIRAFSSICPHSRCARTWSYTPGTLTCTCHTSRFDTNGSRISGPAKKDLVEITVNRQENILTIG